MMIHGGSPLGYNSICYRSRYDRFSLMKNRDQLFEMSKHKMEVISKCMPIYTQLGDYYDELSTHLGKPMVDIDRAFFCASKIFLLENTIFEKYGTVQLNSLEAEEIIESLELELNMDYLSVTDMRTLANEHPTYRDFLNSNLSAPLLTEFNRKFFEAKSKPKSSATPNLQQKCDWYCQLIFLEINEVFSLWYNEHPLKSITALSPDLRSFLDNMHPDYYKRIRQWEKGRLQ
jgi:hypothetical protein